MSLSIEPDQFGAVLLILLLRQLRLEANLRQITMTQSEILSKLNGRGADDLLWEMEVDGQADTDVAVIDVFRNLDAAEEEIHALLVEMDQTRGFARDARRAKTAVS